MGSNTRISIVDFLRANPGRGCDAIAAHIGVTPLYLRNDLYMLRKAGVIRRDGEKKNATWHVAPGADLPRDVAMPGRPTHKNWGYLGHADKGRCAYHARVKSRGGFCPRCLEAGDALRVAEKNDRKRIDARLKKMFPALYRGDA